VGALLHHLAAVQHHHPVAEEPHHRQVVAHEDQGQAELLHQVEQEVEHLGADAHVERAHRLVGQQDPGRRRQGAGNGDALALATGELVGVAPSGLGRQPHRLEQLGDPLLVAAGDAQPGQRLGHDGPHPHARVERPSRVLEHQLHTAAQRPDLALGAAAHHLTLEADGAGRGLLQTHQQLGQRGLARSRLAHHAHPLAGRDGERDPPQGVHHRGRPPQLPLGQEVVLHHLLGGQQRFGPSAGGRGLDGPAHGPSSIGNQQATRRPGPIGSSGGRSAQRSWARGQRVRNTQPAGKRPAGGT
jgi:hypothetical protein